MFSPDGQWIAFSSEKDLMKIPTTGGTPALIVSGSGVTSDYFINLTWGADDRIRYPTLYFDAIRSVPASGGTVDTIAFAPGVRVHRAEGLPDGRLLVSVTIDGERQIALRESDGSLRTLIAGWDARLTPTGYLLFSREEGALWSPTTPSRIRPAGARDRRRRSRARARPSRSPRPRRQTRPG